MPLEFHREMLSDAGMQSIREALIKKYRWFLHDSTVDVYDSIKRKGLLPFKPDGYIGDAPDIVLSELGLGSEKIVCLWPLDCSVAGLALSKNHRFRLALNSTDLPNRIGLDWSFPHSWNLRGITKAAYRQKVAADVFVYVVDGTGSVACYDPISPRLLRVCPKGAGLNSDPSKWPPLVDTSVEDIRVDDDVI